LPVLAIPALLWVLSPLIAYLVSKPIIPKRKLLVGDDVLFARSITRRTWRFFETFVGLEDNWLPPDNFQEDPQPVLAHRTSPTNLGLYLLCAVSARDFGWIGAAEAVERLEATLATMQKMQRFRGHFYNWYDTRDLRPLDPPYVSSVDSGNLAAHLIAVANACREWVGAPVAGAAAVAGVEDAIQLAREALLLLPEDRPAPSMTRHQVEDAMNALIAEPAKSVLDIALDVGFNSKSTFNAAFRQHAGMTPREFRASRRNAQEPAQFH